METATKTSRTSRPLAHYWGLIKGLDDSQKLELASLIIESVKPAATKASQADDSSLKPYTLEELNARIDKAERDSAESRYRTHDEVFAKYRNEILEAV